MISRKYSALTKDSWFERSGYLKKETIKLHAQSGDKVRSLRRYHASSTTGAAVIGSLRQLLYCLHLIYSWTASFRFPDEALCHTLNGYLLFE